MSSGLLLEADILNTVGIRKPSQIRKSRLSPDHVVKRITDPSRQLHKGSFGRTIRTRLRRLRQHDSQLPANYERLELRRAAPYRARLEVLNGQWKFPEPQPAG
jgi:hypothetical protein